MHAALHPRTEHRASLFAGHAHVPDRAGFPDIPLSETNMETKVGDTTQGLLYTASSLEDMAQFFDGLARNSRTLAEHAVTQKQRRYDEGEAAGYQHAADVLRRTELRSTNLVRPENLPPSVEADLAEYVKANPERFDGVPFDGTAAWGLKDALDGFLRWNGVVGYTDRILAICKAAYAEERS